jgi:transcriptional regulator with XRE-family HTH domain
MSFAEAVRAHRLRGGLSQEDLASVTGIAPRSIRNLERAGRGGQAEPRNPTHIFWIEPVRRRQDVLGMARAWR